MAKTFLSKAYWTLATLGGIWAIAIGLLLTPDLQRFALYANKFHTGYWTDLTRAEQWGFLPGQVASFNITTADNETLFAWHIIPLSTYIKHEKTLLAAHNAGQSSPALDILRNEPNAKLIIKFHGNAGHVAQGWRPETYRMLASAGSDSRTNTHVLAFDYRGFGYSTGSPTEDGLIEDGIAAVNWALETAKVLPIDIVLYGQSLGTAVSTAVAEYFAVERKISFAGLVIVAPFASIPDLLPRYFIAGFLPTLSPLRSLPRILKWVLARVVDTWATNVRIARLVRESEHINLSIIHARNDAEIPSEHSEHLFLAAANATTAEGMDWKTIMDVTTRQEIKGGAWIDSWTTEGTKGALKRIKLIMFPYGGHNQIMTWPLATKEILDCFQRASAERFDGHF